MAHDMIRTCILQLLILASRSSRPPTEAAVTPHNRLLLAQFRKLIELHFAEKRLPKDYAELLYITPNHLNALCKDTVNKAAGELIRDRILLEAKRLLVNADTSVAEIAGGLSFTDNSHFTRFFKKNTGHTPEEFRRTYINNH
ncbi:MAG: AraC family transcriptional regulator [Chitinophagaceae bacterium]